MLLDQLWADEFTYARKELRRQLGAIPTLTYARQRVLHGNFKALGEHSNSDSSRSAATLGGDYHSVIALIQGSTDPANRIFEFGRRHLPRIPRIYFEHRYAPILEDTKRDL